DRHYVSLCEVLGLEELIDDPRFDNRDKRVERADELMPIIRAEFTKKTTAEWAELLTEAGVMNAPVANYDDFMGDEHVQATNSFVLNEQPGVGEVPLINIPGLDPIQPGSALSESPSVGQHSASILRDAGYSQAQIDEYVASGVVGGA
ncbi:MAG: hypothetical protein CMQ61_00415, partial [Gammaproteobacteria bacterium]|nr:hypothetical protein [Gammaproteobacteria bacterium]